MHFNFFVKEILSIKTYKLNNTFPTLILSHFFKNSSKKLNHLNNLLFKVYSIKLNKRSCCILNTQFFYHNKPKNMHQNFLGVLPIANNNYVAFTFFVGTMAMMAAAVFFFFEMSNVEKKWRTSILVSGLITFIAAVHYY